MPGCLGIEYGRSDGEADQISWSSCPILPTQRLRKPRSGSSIVEQRTPSRLRPWNASHCNHAIGCGCSSPSSESHLTQHQMQGWSADIGHHTVSWSCSFFLASHCDAFGELPSNTNQGKDRELCHAHTRGHVHAQGEITTPATPSRLATIKHGVKML